MHRVYLLLLASLLATAFAGIEERITEYDLDNGLHVIIYVDSAVPVVSTHVWYGIGSYYEPPGHTGLSHMLEHMTFKHTDAYEHGNIHRIIKEKGGRNNGFTSTFYTGYYETFASDRWELALELEAARMATCRFHEEEFQPEKQVVTEEWRLGYNRPTSRLWTEFDATAFKINPQRNPVIGWPDDVRNYTLQAVEDWYDKHYTPANAVLVVAGDVDPADARQRIEKHFGPIPNGPDMARADFYDAEPEQIGERRVEVRIRTQAPALLIGYHVPGTRDTIGYFTGEVIEGIMLKGQTSRLHRRLVVETGLASWVSGGNYVSRDPGMFVVSVTPRSADAIPEIERVVAEELALLTDTDVSERELTRVYNLLIANDVFARDDVSRLARVLASYHIRTGSWRNFERYSDRVRAISTADIRAFARRWFTMRNRTVGVLLPPGETETASGGAQ